MPEGAPIKLDFTSVPGLEPVPAGSYRATIVKVESRKSQQGDYPYLNWELDLDHPEYGGRKLWLMTSLSPRALWKLRDVLKNLGFDEDALKGELTLDLDDMAGVEVMAEVSQEEWRGQDGKLDPPQVRNRVDMVHLASRGSRAAKPHAAKKAAAPAKAGRKVR